MSRRNGSRASGPPRVIAYTRVSTDEQAASGAGLGAQEAAIQAAIEARGWKLLRIEQDAGASGKSLRKRPALERALADLSARAADVLLVSKLDRVSRSLLDYASLAEQARREGWLLIALDAPADPSTPQGEMVTGILATFAQYERRLISQRTRDGLAIKKAAGVRLGRPRTLPDAVVARIVNERRAGSSTPAIARRLNEQGVPTAHGGSRWYPSTIAAVLRSAEREPVAA